MPNDRFKIDKFLEFISQQNFEQRRNSISLNQNMYEMVNKLEMDQIIEVESEDA